MARVAVRFRVPFRMCRGAQRPADQGSRLSERRRREFERDPAGREHRRLPAAKRRDTDCRVALSLVTFFRRRERKLLACRATPGLRPQPKHKDSKRRFFATAVQPTSRQKHCRDSEPRPQGLALAAAPVATNARSAFSRTFKRRSFSNPTRTMIFCPLDRLCSCGSANS